MSQNPLLKLPEIDGGEVAFFAADMHLDASRPRTSEAFFHWLTQLPRANANSVFLLGDLFEYWIGDDDLNTPLHQAFVAHLLALHQADVRIFVMHGNRDFLLGRRFADACHAQLLPDPCIATIAGQRYVLSHGDALCTQDTQYQRERAIVRHPIFKAILLALPFSWRQGIAKRARARSLRHQQGVQRMMTDVTPEAVDALLVRSGCHTLIHGHTHRPAIHDLGQGRARAVLSDWDLDHPQHTRSGVLRVDSPGISALQADVTRT